LKREFTELKTRFELETTGLSNQVYVMNEKIKYLENQLDILSRMVLCSQPKNTSMPQAMLPGLELIPNNYPQTSQSQTLSPVSTIFSPYQGNLSTHTPVLPELLIAKSDHAITVARDVQNIDFTTSEKTAVGVSGEKKRALESKSTTRTKRSKPSHESSSPSKMEWSVTQDMLLTHLAKDTNNWDSIAQSVGKSPQSCKTRLNELDGKGGKWSTEEDRLLLAAYHELKSQKELPLYHNQSRFWDAVSKNIPGRDGKQCMARYTEALDPNVT
jgi:hypothetical protein